MYNFADKEELLREREENIKKLKNQYEEMVNSKKELDEFKKGGEEDVNIANEELEEKNLPDISESFAKLGFRVSWSPVNEKVAKQVLDFRDVYPMNKYEAKHWFYLIRREELKMKKAQEIL